MYAVIKTGGKQYRVEPEQSVFVEKLDAEEGAEVTFDQVLMVANEGAVTVGTPYVKGAVVHATVEKQSRHKRIEVIKFKRRQGYRRTIGHKQPRTELRVTRIEG